MATNSNSRERARHAFAQVIDSALLSLYQVWDKMGFDETQKKSREDTALHHVRNLMEDMLKEEEILMGKIAKTIEDFSQKLSQLCEDLSIPNVKLSSNLTMVQREKILRTKVEALTKEKTDRMAKYSELHDKDQHVCQILSLTPYYIPSGIIPSLEQLKELETHLKNRQTERDKRFTEFLDLKNKISHLYKEMESEPDTSFGRDVLNEDDETFTLSSSNMETLRHLHEELLEKNMQMKRDVEDLWLRLRALWNRLETPELDREAFELNKEGHGKSVVSAIKAEIEVCEQLKFQNIRKFIDGIRSELLSWWDKCFFSAEQRSSFKLYSEEENFSEELLEAHEKELEKLRAYYNEHRDILDRLDRREHLFRKMVVFEEKASDPNRFFNDRGGKLLQEEKARTKLMKDLPKVEEEVGHFIETWERENREFFIHGLRFPQYIEKQKNDFYLRREQQKQDRIKAKAKQTQEEMLFGSKSVMTPGKRRAAPHQSIVRTPLKARKLNEIKTPNTTSRLNTNSSRFQHSTMLQSPFSRQPLYTPKTPVNSSNKKRRSLRLMKKAATERKANSSRRRSKDQFSHTTVSSDSHQTSTLASTGTYHDFANCVTESKTSSPQHSTKHSDF